MSLEEATDPVRTISYGILKPGPDVAGGVPYVRVVNFRNDVLDVHGLRRTTSAIAAKYARASLEPHDVLVSIRGTYGRVVVVPEALRGANITQDTARLAFLSLINPRFAAIMLRSPFTQTYLKRVARGVAVKGVNIADLRAMPFPLPSPDEQQQIVDIVEDHLSRLDAASVLLRSTESRWETLWQSAVEGELTGRRLTGEREESSGLSEEGVDDGALPLLPRGWRWQRLRDLADVAGGVTKDAKRQGDPSNVEVPYLRVANVQRGFLDLGNVTSIRVPQTTAQNLRLIPGDVLLNEGGDRDKLGRGWVWEGQIDCCIHQNHVFRARVRDEAIDPYLLSWAANLIGGRWCEANGRQSVNLASISLSKIRLMPVPVPPRADQPAILGRLQALSEGGMHLRRNTQTASVRVQALRRSVLTAAFAGRLTGRTTEEEILQELADV